MMRRKVAKSTSVKSNNSQSASNVKIGSGKFTFWNGDSYEGKYKLDVSQHSLVKQDQGVYATGNFDVYDGKWNDDSFANDEFHIRYNNDAQYKGKIDANGVMDGVGTYIFPDGSSITAIWSRNKPVSDIIYEEPLGYEWIVELASENQVSFVRGNYFWDEIRNSSSSI